MVLIPLRDDNPIRFIRFPYVTVGLIAACVVAYLWQLTWGPAGDNLILGLGTVPAAVVGEVDLPDSIELVPPSVTLLTAIFLHGSFMHLAGNMMFLWIFGDNVEDGMGHVRFLIFYLLCGIGAGLIYIITAYSSTVPAIGASGAISGVLGAYLLLHPKARVLTLFLRMPVTLPAFVVLGLWIAFQIFSASFEQGGEGGGVAWWAHIGGFAVGTLLIAFFRRRGVPLLDGGFGRR
jgi:membrane associated rhomboid family serine protease